MYKDIDLDFLVISFKILHKNKYIIHATTEKLQYLRYNSIFVRIYQGTNI